LKKGKSSGDKSESSGHADSDVEGSLYDKDSDEDELEKIKQKRLERRHNEHPRRANNLCRVWFFLSLSGKLNPKQKEIVADKINHKFKKVRTFLKLF
jgi:hypothetical protein